jgi:WD40 repeat protein
VAILIMNLSECRFRAFLSYSQKDRDFGSWLHRSLERYRIPAGLVGTEGRDGPLPATLAPIFRDRDELSASPDLPEVLRAALKDSATLIVLCSKNAASSRWVNEEIAHFAGLGRGDRIIAAIHDSAASLEADGSIVPFLPSALIGENAASDSLLPLAVDFRSAGDGRRDGLLKVVAAVLGTSFDALKRRDEVFRRQRLTRLALAASVAAAAFLALAFYALAQARLADERAIEAAAKRDQAVISQSKLMAKRAMETLSDGDGVRAANETIETFANSTGLKSHVRELELPLNLFLVAQRERFVFPCAVQFELRQQMSFGSRVAIPCANDQVRIYDVRTGKETLTLGGHSGVVNDVAFSSDGQTIVIASQDRSARIYDAVTGQLRGELKENDGEITRVFFPGDSSRIVTVSSDLKLRVWSINGNPLTTIKLPADAGYPDVVAIDRAGTRAITASSPELDKGFPRVWNLNSGSLLAELKDGEAVVPVGAAFFGASGQTVYTTDWSGLLSQWEGGKRVFSTKIGKIGALSGDGKTMVVADDNGVFSTSPNLKTARTKQLASLKRPANFLALSQNGPLFAVASADNRITVGDFGGRSVNLVGHGDRLLGAVFADEGKSVVTSSKDGTTRVWSVAEYGAIPYPAGSIASPDGARLAVVIDKNLVLLDSKSGAEVATLVVSSSIKAMDFSADGKRLLVNEFRGRVQIFDAATGKVTYKLTDNERFMGQSQVSVFSSDGLLAVTGGSKSAFVWDASSGQLIRELPQSDTVEFIRASREQVVVLDHAGLLSIWNARSGERVAGMGSKADPVLDFEINQRGSQVIICFGKRFEIWDLAPSKAVILVPQHSEISSLGPSLQFSPDGTTMTIVDIHDAQSSSITIRRLDDSDLSRKFEFYAPSGNVNEARSPDGRWPARRAAQSGINLTINAWIHRPGILRDQFKTLAFSKDNRRVAFSDSINHVSVVDTATGDTVSSIKLDELVSALAFAPDGETLFVATPDNFLQFRAADGSRLHASTGLPGARVIRSARDGARLLVASDGAVRVWNTAPLRELTTFRLETPLELVEFVGDGSRIMTSGKDNIVRAWSASNGILLFAAPQAENPWVSLALNEVGNLMIVGGAGTAKAYRLSDAQELIERAQARVPRCLTPTQRAEIFNPGEPPEWCITGGSASVESAAASGSAKWPYQGKSWSEWLVQSRSARSQRRSIPAVPNTVGDISQPNK